jgi:hypothetical protein
MVMWGGGYQSNSQGSSATFTLYVNNSPQEGYSKGGFNVEYGSHMYPVGVVAGWNVFINIADSGPGGTVYTPFIWGFRYA